METPSQPPRSASTSTTKMPSTTRPVSQNRISSDVTTGPLTELYEEVETPNNKSLKLGLGVGISLFVGFLIVAVFLLLKRLRNRRSISRKDNGKKLHTKIYLGKSPKTGVSDTDGRMSLQTRDYATLNYPEDQRVSSRHPDSFYHLLESDTDRHLPMVAVNTSRHNEMSGDDEYDKLVRQGDPSLINNVNKQTELDYQATRPKHNNGYDHVERLFPSQTIEISDHEYSVATNLTPMTDQSYDHLDRQVTARSTKDDMVVSSSTYDVLQSVNDPTEQDIQSPNKSQINDPHQYETTLIKQIGNVNG